MVFILIYFTSDLFFGNNEISSYRGFNSVDSMNKLIISRWNSTVSNNDTVYILGGIGDFNFINMVNGHKILIMSDKEESYYNAYISSVSSGVDDMIDREMFDAYVCSNFSIDRVIFSNRIICTLSDGKIVVLTSDIENKYSMDFFNIAGNMGDLKKFFDDGYNVNTGINYYCPVSENTILGLIN